MLSVTHVSGLCVTHVYNLSVTYVRLHNDVPSRGRRCPLTRGLGFPHGDFDFPHRDFGVHLHAAAFFPAEVGIFPCTAVRLPCTWVWIPLYGQTGGLEGAGRGRHRKTG